MRRISLSIGAVLVAAAGCVSGPSPTGSAPGSGAPSVPPFATFPPAPVAPSGPVRPATALAADDLVTALLAGTLDRGALAVIATSEDARQAWLLSDVLRFIQERAQLDPFLEAFEQLTGVPRTDTGAAPSPWQRVTDILIAWDLPAAPGYVDLKARIFLAVEPAWEPFFADAEAAIDWRLVSWGGVLIDDRPLGSTRPCARGCIPALDHPRLTSAAEGSWYPDDRIVFGLVIGDEAVALPRNIMEVHEMVNMRLGGRQLGIPYCTLCGSAQAYFTDDLPDAFEMPVLRTSGLLSRSNKVMYDLRTRSVLDTFTGRALSGPLREAGVVLTQVTLVITTWAEWRAAHPTTRIIAEDGGLNIEYPLDPLGGRDDAGPIFPIGAVDPRLPVQARVLGVIDADGTPVAFPVDQARAALAAGENVTLGSVVLETDAGGLRARLASGEEIPAHEAFWFAWSQFHPGTLVWTPLGG